jgi:hypothetical protein
MPSTRVPFAIIQVDKTKVLDDNKVFLEPIGSTKPKFSSIVNLSAFNKDSGHGLALTCPAQGLPLPSFR